MVCSPLPLANGSEARIFAGAVRRPSIDTPLARRSRPVVRHALHARLVDLLDLVARMRQARGQLAVVGEHQQPFRVVVEPPDRIDVLLHGLMRSITVGRPSGSLRVVM